MQKFTNKHNLPEEVVAAITKDRYTVEGEEPSDYSASRLVAPIQKTVLETRYKGTDKLKVFDVIDQFWSFFGSVAHQVLEESWHESMGSVVEERLYMDVMGKTLSGKMDCYHNGEIRDYKTTKVYKIMRGDYTDWEIQQNIYAELCRRNNWPVKAIKIVTLLNDWKEGEAYKQNYPEAPCTIIHINLWTQDKADAWIFARVAAIEAAMELPDEELPRCTDEEKWANFKDWAIIKKGAGPSSRASRSFPVDDGGQEAEAHIKEKGWEKSHEVIKRVSPPKRCQKYCAAATVCKQWAEECGGMPTNETETKDEAPLF